MRHAPSGTRHLLVAVGLATALFGAGVAGFILTPAVGMRLVALALVTIVIPALCVVAIVMGRGERRRPLIAFAILANIEAVVLAATFAVGFAYAVLVPLIGFTVLLPVAGGALLLAAAVASGVASLVGIVLALTIGPAAPYLRESPPLLTAATLALLGAFHVGALWRISDRRSRALRLARAEITARTEAEETHRLVERELRESQKLEAVGRLAGGVAHDFNNLLTAIGGYAELIASSTDDPEVQHDAESIKAAAARAARLTNDLLAVGRRLVLRPELLEINSLVDEIEPMVRGMVRKDIEVVVDRLPDAGFVRVDRAQLSTAIANLAKNAEDAMPKGGRLTLTVARDVRGDLDGADRNLGHDLVLIITDTGTGIPREAQARVFEPFFTTKEVDQGKGLGLPMVYGFVTQSGGHLSLESDEGVGTSIVIRLPEIAQQPQMTVAASQANERPHEAAGIETVLFVEDDPSVVTFGARILSKLGYHVLVAEDAETAVAVASQHRGSVDLVITDAPRLADASPDPAVLVRAVHPEAGVLYVSAYPAEALAGRPGFVADAEFIQRPYTFVALATRIRATLDGKRPRLTDTA